MLSKIIKSIQAWVRQLRHRRPPTHLGESNSHSGQEKSSGSIYEVATDSGNAADGHESSRNASPDQTADRNLSTTKPTETLVNKPIPASTESASISHIDRSEQILADTSENAPSGEDPATAQATEDKESSLEAIPGQTSPENEATTNATETIVNKPPHLPPSEHASAPLVDRPKQCSPDSSENKPSDENAATTLTTEDQGSAPGSISNVDAESREPSTKESSQDAEPRAPGDFGGRRNSHRNTRQPSPKGDTEAKYTPRPELVCRKRSGTWQWEVLLSANDECNITSVRHHDQHLNAVGDEYSLASLTGCLSVEYKDRAPDQMPLFDGSPMIFRSGNHWRGDARKVCGIASGHYIVIAPKEWVRRGLTPVEREVCTVAEFMAHFFYIKRDEPSADIGGFDDYDGVLTQSGFGLTGESVFDESEDGTLFVGDVPKLHPASNVVWARVGEEGEESESGWRGANFKPAEESLAAVLSGRQGRFFIRVYDADTKRLDSGEFRYLRDLREIRINGEPYTANTLLAPLSAGHSSAKLQFIGVDGASFHPRSVTGNIHANLQPEGIVIVAPHQEGDRVCCALPVGKSYVDAVVKLPRIWWRMESVDSESDQWRDTPLEMTRQQFREFADSDALMRLCIPSRITSINVGFDTDSTRRYQSKKAQDAKDEDTTCEIALLDFNDHLQIDQRLYKEALLNANCNEVVVTLVRISADPVPEIISFYSEPTTVKAGETTILRWDTLNAETNSVAICPGIGPVESSGSAEVALSETRTYTLRLTGTGMEDMTKNVTVTVHSHLWTGEEPLPCVRRGGSYRWGKGFSPGELGAAGLTTADAASLSIPVDRRRRSTHQDNIETIGRLINA